MDLKAISKEVRKDILLQVYSANSGHPGGSLSCADILTSIYFDLIEEGDKVVLSKGHAAPALYAVLAEKGIKVTEVELRMLLESALSEFNKVFENSGTQGTVDDWVASNEGSTECNAE